MHAFLFLVILFFLSHLRTCADPDGAAPTGKSQVIWVSLENKQLDPHPRKSWTPSWKMLDPSPGAMEQYSCF